MEIKRHIDSRKVSSEPAILSETEKKIMNGEDSTHSTAEGRIQLESKVRTDYTLWTEREEKRETPRLISLCK